MAEARPAGPIPAADPADPADNLAQLRRGLLRARGSFALYVAVSNSPRRSRELIRLLGDAVPGIEVVELEPGVEDPLAAVVDAAEVEAAGPLMVLGLERSLSTDEETAPLLRVLNMQRERWPKALRRPVVLWVPEFLLELLGRSAPDFLDWRSGTFFFLDEDVGGAGSALLAMDAAVWKGGLDEGLSEANRKLRIEELRSRLASTVETSDRAVLAARGRWLYELGLHLWRLGAWNGAEEAFRDAAALAEMLGQRRNIASCYGEIGNVIQARGDYDVALTWHQKALTIREGLEDLAGMSASYHHLGILGQLRGAYEDAAAWFHRAIELFEKLDDQLGVARSYHQLGNLAHLRGAHREALEWYKKALFIFMMVGDRANIARSYHQLGLLAHVAGAYDDALSLYRTAQTIFDELGDRAGLVHSYHQLGLVAQARGANDEAIGYYRRALEMSRELGDRAGMANSLSRIGILSTRGSELESAVPFNLRSLAMRLDLGIPEARADLHWLRRQRDLLGENRFWEIVEREGTVDRDLLARLLDEPEWLESEATAQASTSTPA